MNETVSKKRKRRSAPHRPHKQNFIVLFGFTRQAGRHRAVLEGRISETLQKAAFDDSAVSVWRIGEGALLVRTAERMTPEGIYTRLTDALPAVCWEYLAVFAAHRCVYNGETNVDHVIMGDGGFPYGNYSQWLNDDDDVDLPDSEDDEDASPNEGPEDEPPRAAPPEYFIHHQSPVIVL